jgi:hypothetical protein
VRREASGDRTTASTSERLRPSSSDAPAVSGPAWQLAPSADGGMVLVRTGARPRMPIVDAGQDQQIRVTERPTLRGVIGADATARWSRAYGPGPVAFTDSASPAFTCCTSRPRPRAARRARRL